MATFCVPSLDLGRVCVNHAFCSQDLFQLACFFLVSMFNRLGRGVCLHPINETICMYIVYELLFTIKTIVGTESHCKIWREKCLSDSFFCVMVTTSPTFSKQRALSLCSLSLLDPPTDPFTILELHNASYHAKFSDLLIAMTL